ncbi:myotubularin-related protein 14-like isoform X2 [Stegodyphus dumicola]|uniref:myotubularin-related protein 14-like isoform X2 n=1 Tax=Stegodyphus dumicola TaxID=202533 RepID=UPI0015A8F5BE|nr:myotubularin-related protein 14-like isoform X2 [Stegodyphus dumicola]
MAASRDAGDIINERVVAAIFDRAARHRYSPAVYDKMNAKILDYCRQLFSKDYECQVVSNSENPGAHYPTSLLIPVEENTDVPGQLRFGGKGSSASDFEFQINIATAAFFMKVKKFSIDMSVDVHLLNHLEVTHICDLRGRDPSRDYPKFAETCELYKTYYTAFKTAHLPYPSVDFFETYYRIREPEELRLNWKKKSPPLFDLTLPDIDSMTLLQTDVSKYREWYTLDQTLNYLLVLQTYLTSDLLSVKGILLHCIAGQDRTPLFVTLLRLSLWADGLLHATLNPLEMLYLTVAYDWYLFGHNLKDCLNRGYWIMHFCYNILDHITSDRFSVRGSEVETASSRCILPCFRPKTDRKKRLLEVKRLFLKFYAQIERRPVQQPSTSTGRR